MKFSEFLIFSTIVIFTGMFYVPNLIDLYFIGIY